MQRERDSEEPQLTALKPRQQYIDIPLNGRHLARFQGCRACCRANQPVIIFTGAGTPETERPLRALGVTEFVEKAVPLQRLEDALKRLIKPPQHTTS